MFDRSRTLFHDKNWEKAAQDFHHAVSKVFDRVKSVALWSTNIRKLAKDHKGYGSAAIFYQDMLHSLHYIAIKKKKSY
jgi:tRNA U34 5-methylaminomethyl-2-thiouridine-forming methyltransferase MnmC